MPLLKRRAFRRASASELLRDDDEVFHCEITDEIFKDYEEYCERIILVNSMVWSCEMTGKPNLTYAEALESEHNARKSLRDFPMELRMPLLYLANRTKRSSLADMLEDVFNFVRERYFIGETVEACLEGDAWAEAHVLSVTAPKHLTPADAASGVKPAALYSYEVEQWDEQDAGAAGQMGTAPSDRVRRRKGVFTREKNRLFIKQFVEQTSSGLFVIKKSALEKYNIHKVKFEQLFAGPPPDFPSSKKFLKTGVSPGQRPSAGKPGSATKSGKLGKKGVPDKKQQSISKYVTKTEKFEGTKPKPTEVKSGAGAAQPGASLKTEMARVGASMQQRKLDERERKKERKAKLAAYIKEWHRQKDDLDLEDHKVLPKATPVEIEGIPSRHLGDFLAVLEFVHLYADILKAKDVFHNGVDIEVLRRALTQKECAGIFSDIVQMLLTTVFSLQEEESEEVNESGSIQESTGNIDMQAGTGVTKAVELATKASKWPQTYLATPLSKLPLDAFTVSEVLRLHLLSSGATAGERCARWRYQQRGGYSSLDDAGLHLRLAHPRVIRNLACSHVADLPLDDKFRILQCLMNQILSYATVRDVIEEKLENQRLTKYEIKMLQAAERRREAELVASRIKLNKEARQAREAEGAGPEGARLAADALRAGLEALEREHEQKRAEYERKLKELQAQCFDYQSYLGMDRAYRGYWLNQSVPGLFVELGAAHCGPCRERPVLPVAPPADTLQYVQKLFESERGASDKENDSANTSRNSSPRKQSTGLNGLSQKLSALDSNTQRMQELLMCTGSGTTCPVHGGADRPRWWVYHEGRQVEELIAALNKRGLREQELKSGLEMDKRSIVEYIEKCPMHMLNAEVQLPTQPNTTRARKFPTSSFTVPAESSLSEALELSLRDYILELEEKVFHGCLGALNVKDREAWRGTILLRSYDKQADYLTWGPNQQYRDDFHLPNGKIKAPQVKDKESGEDIKPVLNNYRDPGTYLEERGLAVWAGCPPGSPARADGRQDVLDDVTVICRGVNGTLPAVKEEKPDVEATRATEEDGEQQQVVRGLASALLQISQAISHKYLKRPLGYDEKERKDHETKGKPLDFRALQRWEVSLMECRSFAQVALHLLTLDSSVTWSASILNASCRLCRRKTDGDNMLLCDGCNKGHHMYCLKPKLTKVPEGDWYCDQCKPKEKTPRKRRRLFNDNVQEEKEEQEEEEEGEEPEEVAGGVCGECGSGGRLSAVCTACRGRWHAECAQPRPPRGHTRLWKCALCLVTNRREHGVRRCAVDSMNNIHHYTRILNNDDSRLTDTESECSDDNVVLLKIKGRRVRSSKESSPAVQPERKSLASEHASGKRSRKSYEESAPPAKKSRSSGASTPLTNGHGGGSKSKKSLDEPSSATRKSKSSAPSTPVTNGDHEGSKGSARAGKSKRGSRGAALRAGALQELLRDVMRHRDAWPFCEPVSIEEVPDYLSVVTEPMDFQTLSDKLAAGEYSTDAQAMRDAALVFHNSYIYNQDTHPVARAGARLEKFFAKRCAELDLPSLPDLTQEQETQSAKSKRSKHSK